jgi:hypothetical protein
LREKELFIIKTSILRVLREGRGRDMSLKTFTIDIS